MKLFNAQLIQNVFILGLVTFCLNGCSAGGTLKSDKPEKQVIDTGAGSNIPAWVQDTKVSWIVDGNVHRFKAFHSIRGDERLMACYELAKLNAHEQIASEIWTDFKALVSHSTQGISESSEDAFTQSRNLETRGNIRGLRFSEAFHQRYLVNGVERIDCFVLGELSDSDFRQMRAHILAPVISADSGLRKTIEENHINLFKGAEAITDKNSNRAPTSAPDAQASPAAPVTSIAPAPPTAAQGASSLPSTPKVTLTTKDVEPKN